MSRNRRASLPLSARAPGVEPVAGSFVGLPSETIVLETLGFDLPADDLAPASIKERFELKDPVRATRTELTVFREHFLMVRVRRKGEKLRSALINLRYLDARPGLARVVAGKML